jgi:hypothetical protein
VLTTYFEGFVLRFWVNVCRGGAQVVVAASRAIMFPRLQPHLDGDVEKLVGVVWSLRILSSCGIFGSSRSFIGSLSYFFVSGMDVVFSTHSATSCPQLFRPTQGEAAASARHRHGLEVENEGFLKKFVVIFIFLGLLYTVRCFF